jgi:hypothetical protein
MMRSLLVGPSAARVLYFVTAAGLSVLACKKNDGEAANGGYVQGQAAPAGAAGMAPGVQGGAGGAPVVAAGGAPAAGASAVAGGAPATGGAAAGPLPQRLDPAAAAAVTPALLELGKKEVQPGAKPIGEALVGNFGQGHSLEIPIQLQPNKCYSVVAMGLPPVTEIAVELQLTTIIPGMAPVLAVDQETGPTAVLGRKATCYKWMFGVIPAPAKVVVKVTGGSGLVAAQAYEK